MKIALIHSLDFAQEAIEIRKKLQQVGHEVSECYSVTKISKGDLSVQKVKDMKEFGNFSDYTISKDLIKWNYERIKKDDAILVLNFDKKGIKNYIGGNTLLEIGFAYVLEKKIFFWNDIPDMFYTDELKAMQPVVIKQKLILIK